MPHQIQAWGTDWPVDPADPVNRHHPLNAGRLVWWLALPHTAGVREWYDLLGLRTLTLQNYQITGVPTYWRGTARPGGALELGLHSASTLYASTPWGLVGQGAPRTAALWARPTTAGVAAGWLGVGSSVSDTTPLWFIQKTAGERWAVYAGGNYRTGTAAVTTGAWHHLCYTFDGATHTLYVNGRQDVQAAVPDLPGDNATLYAGVSYPQTADGALDDVSVWGRCLTPAEAGALYDLSRLTYPGVLNRVTPPPGPAPPAADAPWLAVPAKSPAVPPGPAPASLGGWSPRLATPAPDPLAWLLRGAPPPAVEGHTLAVPQAGWRPDVAAGPAGELLPWLARALAPAAGPAAAPTALGGWRPDVAAGPAPPARRARVRFWRGPEAHLPTLAEGEPAWATDTKSLWIGSATGNVRIGP